MKRIDLSNYYEGLAAGRKRAHNQTLAQLGEAQRANRGAAVLLRHVRALVGSEKEARANPELAELATEATSWLAAHEPELLLDVSA